MAIIHQHDKRTGTTYVYESTAYWDKEKKMSRAKRKLIGKLDNETGEIIPTDGRGKKKKAKQPHTETAALIKRIEILEKQLIAKDDLITHLKQQIQMLKG